LPEFLLEIGCEEIPASWIGGLTDQLRTKVGEAAEKEALAPRDVKAFGGPRRLCVALQVEARQPDREEKLWGPAVRAAKDPAGAWTPAALGFAKKNAVEPAAFQEGMKEGGKEPQLYVTRGVAGKPALEILPAIIASSLRGLAFPKRMSWDAWLDDGRGAFPFGRPIRWVVALLGGEVVPFEIFELVGGAKGPSIVRSGRETRGHRFLPKGKAGQPVAVDGLPSLLARLREQHVLLDPEARREAIRAGLRAKAAPEAAHGHELVHEWCDLVEWPTVMAGEIPAAFRSLPVEVLETVLIHHQKYIPLLEGGTVTRFAAVTNTDPSAEVEVVRGMQRVIVARLRDASFFLEEDRRRPLDSRVADLDGVTFHQGLGTYRHKAERLQRLVDVLAEMGSLPVATAEHARAAAGLAKADLTTLMVREFTELQGVMGGIYLGDAPAAVSQAVRWHYHPLSVEVASEPAGRLKGQELATFAAVSLVDKLDTVAGYFGLGLVPSGSSDPYGLRRAAQGALRVVVDFWPEGAPRPSLRALAAEARAGYAGRLKRPAEDVDRDMEAFLLDRLRYLLSSRGFPGDEVEAVLGAREPDALDDAAEALRRVEALHRVRAEAREDFERLATAFKRARNILGKETPAAEVDPALFEHDAERRLLEAARGLAGTRDGAYDTRLRALAGLRAPVDAFFDDVLVMAEDRKVRANRLGLLSEVLSLFYRIADISRLGG
jgi:glycyl-tRNA synthetase beta chain